MGVLGHQQTRSSFGVSYSELDSFLEDASTLAQKHKVDVETVIEARRVLETARANRIKVEAGDYWDEQAGGFGSILTRVADALEDLARRDD